MTSFPTQLAMLKKSNDSGRGGAENGDELEKGRKNLGPGSHWDAGIKSRRCMVVNICKWNRMYSRAPWSLGDVSFAVDR